MCQLGERTRCILELKGCVLCRLYFGNFKWCIVFIKSSFCLCNWSNEFNDWIFWQPSWCCSFLRYWMIYFYLIIIMTSSSHSSLKIFMFQCRTLEFICLLLKCDWNVVMNLDTSLKWWLVSSGWNCLFTVRQ